MKKPKIILALTVWISGFFLFGGISLYAHDLALEALSPAIIKIVDTNTRIPGSTRKFSRLRSPAISGQNVLFSTEGENAVLSGIYLHNGTKLVTVADTRTFIPGSTKKFGAFLDPAISGANIVFQGIDKGGSFYDRSGIYLYNGEKLTTVVDYGTSIPGSEDKFTIIRSQVISGNRIAFSGDRGVYLYDGEKLSTIADTNTDIPGSKEKFAKPRVSGISGRNVVFRDWRPDQSEGIYLYDGTGIVAVADTNTRIPGSTHKFTRFMYPPLISGRNVVFSISDFTGYTQTGIYLFTDNTLVTVADTNTCIPGSKNKFTGFLPAIAFSAGRVAFLSTQTGNTTGGIYLYDDKKLITIANSETNFPSSFIEFGLLGFPSLSGGNLVFYGASGTSYPPNVAGIFLYNGGKLRTIVDNYTNIPGSEDTFDRLNENPAVSGGNVAFCEYEIINSATVKTGIYLYKQ